MNGQGVHEMFSCTRVVLEAQVEFVRAVDSDRGRGLGGGQED